MIDGATDDAEAASADAATGSIAIASDGEEVGWATGSGVMLFRAEAEESGTGAGCTTVSGVTDAVLAFDSK